MLESIWSGQRSGFVVVQDLELCRTARSPHMGFCTQRTGTNQNYNYNIARFSLTHHTFYRSPTAKLRWWKIVICVFNNFCFTHCWSPRFQREGEFARGFPCWCNPSEYGKEIICKIVGANSPLVQAYMSSLQNICDTFAQSLDSNKIVLWKYCMLCFTSTLLFWKLV